MRIIAIANQKGGCGKTTTSINLSSCLSFLGKQVLLIDFDPQGHATLGLGIRSGDYEKSVFDVIDFPEDGNPSLSDIIVKRNEYLDVVPADVVLSAIEQKLAGVPGRETRLLEKLTTVGKDYDFIVIDCPPSLGLLTFNALMAAEELIVPLEPSTFSLHGLQKIFETVHLLKEGLGHDLSIRALMTMFEARTRFAREFETKTQEFFGDRVYRVKIRRTVSLREAAQAGKAIVDFNRESSGFEDYMNLACELIEEGRVRFQPSDVTQEIQATQETQENQEAQEIQEIHEAKEMRSPVLMFEAKTEGVLFSIELPLARSVQLAGDFNNWLADDLTLTDNEKGRWEIKIPVTQGRYRYKFIVDGQWCVDPKSDIVEANGYGTFDSVIEVGAAEHTP